MMATVIVVGDLKQIIELKLIYCSICSKVIISPLPCMQGVARCSRNTAPISTGKLLLHVCPDLFLSSFHYSYHWCMKLLVTSMIPSDSVEKKTPTENELIKGC